MRGTTVDLAVRRGWLGGHRTQNVGKASRALYFVLRSVEILNLQSCSHPSVFCLGPVFVDGSSSCATPGQRVEEKLEVFAESRRRQAGAIPCGLSGPTY